jgi:alpha-tubulin suppressor-like RCC1 family protein
VQLSSSSSSSSSLQACLCAHPAIFAGADHAVAVIEDGSVWSWGGGSEHQLGCGQDQSSHSPQKLQSGLPACQAVVAGDKYTLALSGTPLDPNQALPMRASGRITPYLSLSPPLC